MEHRSIRVVLGLCLLAYSGVALAAERRPWPRRPGVVLVQPKEGGVIESIHRTQAASLSASDVRTEEDMAEALMKSGQYAFAEPDYLMPAAQTPNDPQYPAQWHHPKIHSADAWDASSGDGSVTVAILDTGIDAAHPDLAPNLLPGWNVVSQNADTTPVADHGTWVAGVVGAAGNNALGVSGMNWNVRLLPVRITNNADTTAWCSDMARGITWATDHGAQFINMSYNTLGCPQTIETASRYARQHGVLVFLASGNEGIDITPFYPATHTAILVGASDNTDQRASFSNTGSPINLMAPGARIFTTAPGGQYETHDGTSFASPMVAGVAALIKAYHPAFTADEIQRILYATARTGLGMDGQGRVDAGGALSVAKRWAESGVWPEPIKLAVDGTDSDVASNAPVLSHTADVRVFPNPWRSDRHAVQRVTFDPLSGATGSIQIYTVSGHLVKTLPATTGPSEWDLTTESGDRVASGLYIYLASGDSGAQSRGKLAVIR